MTQTVDFADIMADKGPAHALCSPPPPPPPPPVDALTQRLTDLTERTAEAERRKLAQATEAYRGFVRKTVDGVDLSDAEVAELQEVMERLEVSDADLKEDVQTLKSAMAQAERVSPDDAEYCEQRAKHKQTDAELRQVVEAAQAKVTEAQAAVEEERRRFGRYSSQVSTLQDLVKKNPRLFERVDGGAIDPVQVGVEKSAKKTKGKSS